MSNVISFCDFKQRKLEEQAQKDNDEWNEILDILMQLEEEHSFAPNNYELTSSSFTITIEDKEDE